MEEELNDTQKASAFDAIIDKMGLAEKHKAVAEQLEVEYGSNFEAFFEDLHTLLSTFHDLARLKFYLQEQAETRSSWARAFLGNAQLVMRSLVK